MKDNRNALDQLGRHIGLPGLKFNREGICELTVGDGIDIYFQGDDDATALHLNGVVGTMPSADARVLRALLAANHNGQATGGAALALDSRTSEIVLTRTLEVAALPLDQLVATLEAFVKYVAFWRDYLPGMAIGAPGPAADALPDDPATVIRV